ncbi:MAG: hypothetical protein WC510_01005 [Candidatus Omnitrophota bacterium]
MEILLKRYSQSGDYADIFRYNYEVISRIQDDDLLNKFVLMISSILKIDYQVILVDLKRYLMISQEYYPHNIQKKCLHYFLLPYFVFRNIVNSFHYARIKHSDIIIDSWYPDSLDTFYGQELIGKLLKKYRCIVLNFMNLKSIDFIDFFRYFPEFIRCFLFSLLIIKKHGIDLRRYTFSLFFDFLRGRFVKSHYKPRMIISGNDNGLSVIKSKASGAGMFLIQNGLRDYSADSSFKYADHYVSMGEKCVINMRQETGCIFKNIYTFGSLRLHNFLSGSGDLESDILYDVLWVSTYNLFDNENIASKSGYCSMDSYYSAIRLINGLALNNPYRVAFQCRYEREVEDLRKLGLFCERIIYINNLQKSVYQSVLESDIILTAVSTVSLEAMALKKKIGLINLSDNRILNHVYRGLGIEYNLNSRITLEEFIESLRNKVLNFKDYIRQDPCYAEDLLGAVARGTIRTER